jgi:hypothetical protein
VFFFSSLAAVWRLVEKIALAAHCTVAIGRNP